MTRKSKSIGVFRSSLLTFFNKIDHQQAKKVTDILSLKTGTVSQCELELIKELIWSLKQKVKLNTQQKQFLTKLDLDLIAMLRTSNIEL